MSKTILLVEDELLILAYQVKVLEKFGYRVIGCKSGEEAIEKVSECEDISLILMDIDLGKKMDGTEAARKILQTKDIPLIFFSAHSEPEIVEKTEGITSYGYILKNSDPTILNASIKMAFRLYESKQNEKKKEVALSQSELFFRTFFEQGNVGFAVTTSDGHWVQFNDKLCQITGYTKSELESMSVFDILLEETRESDKQKLLDLLEKDEYSGEIEKEFVNKQGNLIKIIVTLRIINNEQLGIKNAAFSILDITQRKKEEVAIKESEIKYHSLFSMLRLMSDTMPDMLWAKDLEKKYIFGNKALCENLLMAHDTQEILGKTDMYFASRERNTQPDNPAWHTFGEVCQDSDRITLEAGHAMSFHEFGNVKGIPLHLEVHKAPLKNNEGVVIGVVGSGRDITESIKVQHALLEKQEIQRVLLDESPDPIFSIAHDGTYLYVNRAFSHGVNKSLEEITGKKISDVFEPEEAKKRMSALLQVFNTGEERVIEVRVPRTDGDRYYITTITPIKNPQGIVLSVICSSKEITDRKKTEVALQESEARLKSMFANIPALILLKDEDFRLIHANEMTHKYFPVKDWLGKLPHEIFDKEKADQMVAKDTEAMEKGLINYEETWPDKFGINHFFLTIKYRIDIPGKKSLLGGIILDITDRKNAEDSVKSLLQEKELLLQEVHHRIKNNMLITQNLLTLHAKTTEDKAILSPLQDAAGRLKSMGILYDKLYRSSNLREMSLEVYLVPLLDSIRETMPMERKISFVVNVEDAIVNVDKISALGIIVNELITNSVKHAFTDQTNCEIRVQTYRAGDRMILEVSDSGQGMREKVLLVKQNTFGLQLVDMLTKQIGAKAEFVRDKGTLCRIEFQCN